jgi:hypothetical protein
VKPMYLDGLLTIGRWSFYIDLRHQFIGRRPTEDSVVYAVGPLTAEHVRAEVDVEERRRRDWHRAVARWQRVRERARVDARLYSVQGTNEAPHAFRHRIEDRARADYDALAAEARVRGETVPAYDQLDLYMPTAENTVEG